MLFKDIKPFVRFVRQLKITENSVFPEYLPLDARLFYVLDGKGKIKVADRVITLPVGHALFINAGQRYTLLPCDVLYSAVNFDFTQNASQFTTPIPPVNTSLISRESVLSGVTFSDAEYFNSYYLFSDLHSLKRTMAQLENEYVKKLPFYQENTSSLLLTVLITLARTAEKRPSGESRLDIESIVDYIHKNYSQPLDNKTISKEFGFHPNYINSEFKNSLGISLHSYVLETKILKAVALMESDTLSISEISAVCGFCDSNYFSRYFKKIMGVSPTKYMKSGK